MNVSLLFGNIPDKIKNRLCDDVFCQLTRVYSSSWSNFDRTSTWPCSPDAKAYSEASGVQLIVQAVPTVRTHKQGRG